MAVDAVFDSVSVATTFREKLAEAGVIFCSISEAIREHQELIQKYLGSVVPHTDDPAPLLLRDWPGQLQSQAGIACRFELIQRQVIADAAATNERFEVDITAIALSIILLAFQAELCMQDEFTQWSLVIERTADDLPVVLDRRL